MKSICGILAITAVLAVGVIIGSRQAPVEKPQVEYSAPAMSDHEKLIQQYDHHPNGTYSGLFVLTIVVLFIIFSLQRQERPKTGSDYRNRSDIDRYPAPYRGGRR